MAGLRSSPRGTYSDRGEDSVLQEVYRFPVNGGELGEHLSSKWQKTRRPIPDVAVVRLEDGGPEAQPVRDEPQETVPEPVLGPLSRPGSSAHEPAHLGIGLQRAEGVEIFRRVIPKEEPCRLENDHGCRVRASPRKKSDSSLPERSQGGEQSVEHGFDRCR